MFRFFGAAKLIDRTRGRGSCHNLIIRIRTGSAAQSNGGRVAEPPAGSFLDREEELAGYLPRFQVSMHRRCLVKRIARRNRHFQPSLG